MECFSMIDQGTRAEIHDLLARFCHYLDDGQPLAWASLFTSDGTIACDEHPSANGAAELAEVAELVHAKGGAVRRHVITSVMIDYGRSHRETRVRASGLLLDMAHGGVAEMHDFNFLLSKQARWRIRHLVAHRVGTSVSHAGGLFDVPMRERPVDGADYALQ